MSLHRDGGKKSVDLDISDHQIYAGPHHEAMMNAHHRYLLSYGSRDSAKSYSIAQKLVRDCIEQPYFKCVLVRKIGNDIRDSQFATIVDVINDWGVAHLFDITPGNMRIRLKNSKNCFLARGLDKPTRMKSVRNPTVMWIEEANEISREAFLATDMAIRGPAGCLKQMILTWNPEDEACWINEDFFPPKNTYEKMDGLFHFVQSTQKDTVILHTTYLDNRFSEERRSRYDQLKINHPEYYATNCLGLWGAGKKGVIFDNVQYADKFPDENERTKYGFGLDFGFTNDPTALIECCVAHGEIYVRQKIYRTGLVNVSHQPGQASIVSECEKLGIPKNLKIHADSAEPKSIAEIKAQGYALIGTQKFKGCVEASINAMKGWKINIVGSPDLKKEAKNYCYDLDDNGNPTNKPIDAFNHGWDAIRYWFLGEVWQNKTFIADVF